jgi:hypothetical protein
MIGMLVDAGLFTVNVITALLIISAVCSVAYGPRTVWRIVCRLARTAQRLATDKRLPAWLRIVYSTLLLVTHAIPGPVDEALMIIPLMIIVVWYRPVLASVWQATR